MSGLFDPLAIGDLALPHRMVMAPLTRMRAEPGHQPGRLMQTYYAQRAGFGLMVSEGTPVSPLGHGFADTPGLHSDAHERGWRDIVEAVHAEGGRMFLQLWHVGRQSHPSLLPGGARPVAPSALASGGRSPTPDGDQPHPVPRPLETGDVEELVRTFAAAARRARRAGADGVEIHGAHGYLIDQFLRDGSNHRTDRYGGSVANRARFLLEIVEAVCAAWPAERVGVRISPCVDFGNMHDSDPDTHFAWVVRELSAFPLAYLHITEPRDNERAALKTSPNLGAAWLRRHYDGRILSSGGHTRETGQAFLEAGIADLIGYGRQAIANPDLPERFRRDAPLNPYDRETFYGGGAQGYTDYPCLA